VARESDMMQLLSDLAPNAELSRAIVSTFRGISPPMAREIVFRATGQNAIQVAETGPDAARALTDAMQMVLDPLQSARWSPRLYLARGNDGAHDETGAVVAFSAIPFAHLAADYDDVALASISEAAARAETAINRPSPRRHAQRRQRLLDAVAAARERATRRLAALAGQSVRAADAERLRRAGELIYAFLWQIAPGQSELVAEGETIRLDPALSANENAQAYFEQYRKAQSADAQIPELAAESEAEIAYLDQLATFIQQAPGFAELEALAAEWAEQASPASDKPRRKQAPRRPKALVDAAGNSVYVGRSGPQNDLLTFELAGPDDTWLHARGVGGAHVIIRWHNSATPEDPETVAAAAALAAWYSAARESGGVEVDVARRRHVRKIKGGRPGMVTYRNERTIRVQPASEERLRDVLSER
jgi:predicted ribosome quality control (RQC) complex YloA/Tae2 family protein